LFLSDAADPAALVVVPGVDQGLLVQPEELLGDAVPEGLGAAVLEIGPSAAADQQGVAGAHAVAPQVAHASRRVPGGGNGENLLAAEENHIAVLEQQVVPLSVA